MEDLSNSKLFDDRVLDLVRSIFYYGSNNFRPINGNEARLLKMTDDLKKINLMIKDDSSKFNDLIHLLTELKPYIPLTDLLFFLISCKRKKMFDDALQVINMIKMAETVFSGNDLKKILDEADEIPMVFAVAMLGDDVATREEVKRVETSSIDLGRMRAALNI